MEMDHPIFVDDFVGSICRDNRPIISLSLAVVVVVVVTLPEEEKRSG